MRYQLERTTATNVKDESTYVVELINKPVKDLKLAKSMLAVQMMKDERLGIPAKYRIINVD